MPEPAFDAKALQIVAGALISALERKHPYTRGHSDRVSRYALMLAQRITPPLDPETLEFIRLGGLLHDIGKISVEGATLDDTSAILSTDQVVELEDHPHDGVQILRKCGIPIPETVLQCVFSHHERFDGKHDGNLTGYPLGLAGEGIPLAGRIVAIADNFDAMTSKRPYQRMLSFNDAISALKAMRGNKLNPVLIDLFIEQVIPAIIAENK